MPDTVSSWGAFGDEQSDIGDLYALLAARPDWHAQAACQGKGAGPWFPDRGDSTATSRTICAGCPVTGDCLAWALDQDQNPPGVWGGTNAQQRAQMRRQAG